jgi:hypothetical protein
LSHVPPCAICSGTLKGKMADGKEKNSRNLKENVMKMLYIEMLGQNADFGHMVRVALTHAPCPMSHIRRE